MKISNQRSVNSKMCHNFLCRLSQIVYPRTLLSERAKNAEGDEIERKPLFSMELALRLLP